MKNLFGEISDKENIKDSISVNLYCDEIKDKECLPKGKWHYIGILILPVDMEVTIYKDLIKNRFRVDNIEDIDKKSVYYQKNNRIVHFESLDADTYHIAKRWYDLIRFNDNIYFTILGVDHSKLDTKIFGKKDLFSNIYNRFFRTGVIYSLEKYFSSKKITIQNIFHEDGNQKHHDFFPWHLFYKIKTEYNHISCRSDVILFLDKDHRKNNRANFIQLIDVILGAVVNTFHDSTTDEHKVLLTHDFSELSKRLIKHPDNPNSKYCKNYYKRMSISFFPKSIPDPKEENYEFKKRINQFYKEREMVFLNRNQKKLLI